MGVRPALGTSRNLCHRYRRRGLGCVPDALIAVCSRRSGARAERLCRSSDQCAQLKLAATNSKPTDEHGACGTGSPSLSAVALLKCAATTARSKAPDCPSIPPLAAPGNERATLQSQNLAVRTFVWKALRTGASVREQGGLHVDGGFVYWFWGGGA